MSLKRAAVDQKDDSTGALRHGSRSRGPQGRGVRSLLDQVHRTFSPLDHVDLIAGIRISPIRSEEDSLLDEAVVVSGRNEKQLRYTYSGKDTKQPCVFKDRNHARTVENEK